MRSKRPEPAVQSTTSGRSAAARVPPAGARRRAVHGLAFVRDTGMRRGEVAGLAREDLDLEAGTVRIRWTLGVIDNQATWKPRPKSDAGERTMSLDPTTVEALRTHLAAQAEQRLLIGPAWQRRQTDSRGLHRARRLDDPPRALDAMVQPPRRAASLTRIAFTTCVTPTPPPAWRTPPGGTRSRSSPNASATRAWASPSTRTRTSCQPPTKRSPARWPG